MKRIIDFIKKETVLAVAWLLALVSMFIIPPNKGYVDYIDSKSLEILWSLMVIVSGLKNNGLFESIGKFLLEKTKYVWQLVTVLVLLPFFISMLITNDVALLTFVPFSIYILGISGKRELLIPVIAFQTIGANLGSMLTPIGNPQNLYLYGISGMQAYEFIMLMLPYTVIAALLLFIGIFTVKGKREKIEIGKIEASEDNGKSLGLSNYIYGTLFVIAVMSVTFPTVIKYQWVLVIVLIICLILDRKVLICVDYALLFTFIGFFIFTGNLGSIDTVKEWMSSVVNGHEVVAGVITSQFISNVPAALLLSEFQADLAELIVGVNLGGLGTLIASMASLISYKLLAHNFNELKGKYLLFFTGVNVVFLAALLLGNVII